MPKARSYPSFAFSGSSLTLHHTREHISWGCGGIRGRQKWAIGDVFQHLSSACHSVWGRVVPDFCRELVAVLAEDERGSRESVGTPMT